MQMSDGWISDLVYENLDTPLDLAVRNNKTKCANSLRSMGGTSSAAEQESDAVAAALGILELAPPSSAPSPGSYGKKQCQKSERIEIESTSDQKNRNARANRRNDSSRNNNKIQAVGRDTIRKGAGKGKESAKEDAGCLSQSPFLLGCVPPSSKDKEASCLVA